MSAAIDLAELWKPLPTQKLFWDAIANVPDMGMVAYIGGYGSGKTFALARAVIGLALTDPRQKILVGRQYGTDLRDTTQATFFEMIAELDDLVRRQYTGLSQKESLLGEYAAAKNQYQFHNGALVMFRPLDEADKKLKSVNASSYAVDEGSEVGISAMLLLKSRIRKAAGRRVGMVVSNPTNTRHWLYEWFVHHPKSGEPLPDHVLFRTNTMENAANLPPNYDAVLRASYPDDWVRVYLEGQWGELRTGQRPVFPTFSSKLHVGPTEWYKKKPVFVGIDWGYKNPGVVWFQLNDKNQVMIHRCWFPREIHTYALCEGIRKRNDEWFPGGDFWYFAGWDGAKHHASATKTDQEIFNETMPVTVKLVYTHINRGLTIIRNMLDVRDDGTPGLIVNPVNERIIEGFMGGYHYDPVKTQVVSTEDLTGVKDLPAEDGTYDQLMDAFRYGIVSVFDTPTGSPRGGAVYGYRRTVAKRFPLRTSVPHPYRKVIG